jgi:DNA-binding NarL/FixJ family response regulator
MSFQHRILLADDHTMIAQALGDYLKQGGFNLVGIVSDGAALLQSAAQLRPDVIVADISMPLLNGLDAMRRLKSKGINTKFIFLTMHDEIPLACEAMRAGASGYLLKHSAGEELVTAIREVLRGRTYLTPRIAKEVITALSSPQDVHPGAARLTARQRQVLELVVIGRTMKEVAAELILSARTVETHKYDIMQTLGVKTTAELIHYAIRNQLVEC